jgi:GT2 family glycosyltransferase
MSGPAVSVVVPTYHRERVLIDTLRAVAGQLQPGDELLVIDQTPQHEPATEQDLSDLAARGTIRWFRRHKPHICEAMNAGALLAQGEILLFLDDDVLPLPGLVEGHRAGLSGPDAPPATCGQVLQPWHAGPVSRVADFALHFDSAYDTPCDILTLMAGNFAMPREAFLRAGGFDENFFGSCYRLETELSYRIFREFGRKVRFLPGAAIRHLKAGGGTRTFGEKDSWRHISGSVGHYYFVLRSLPPGSVFYHAVRRILREPVNRYTLCRPWLIPSLFARELIAFAWAASLVCGGPPRFAKELARYEIQEPPRGCVV